MARSKKSVLKSVLSIFLSAAMILTVLPGITAQAAEKPESSYPYAVFAGGSGNSLDFCKSNLTVNGDIHSNGKLTVNANNVNINGECGAAEGIEKGQGNFNVRKQVANPETVNMISIPNKVKTTYFTNNCDAIKDSYTKSNGNVNLNRSVYAEKDVHLSGNISLNCCVGSSSNIILDGNTLNSNNTVLYSKSGDITINNDNATVNGLIYAPNGKVTVKGQNFQVNGAIIAKEIKIDSGNVNINRNDGVAKFVGNKCDISIYAYGKYVKTSSSVDISWVSTDKSGKFEVMSSADGNTYSAVTTLTDKDSYSYPLTGSTERQYFKVIQTTSNNITVESNRFEMVKKSNGYECHFDDTDGDGLPDAYEKLLGTDPLKIDTDGDGLTDYQELKLTNTSPLKPDTDGNGISDAKEDPDKDGLTNLEEIRLGTNPLVADTDGDGLKDGDEVHKYKTDPLKADTDDDGINDGDEIRLGLDPNKPDTNGDGVPDSKEKFNQTLKQPINNDCDISEIDVSFTGTGYINNTTSVNSVKNSDKMSANVVGLVGEPFEFKTTSKFSSARICFKINKANLKGVSFNNLAVLWYDEANQIYRLLDTQLDEKNGTVSSEVTHFSKYMVVDKEKWFEAWHKELNYFKNKYVNSDTVLALDCSGSMDWNDPIHTRTHMINVGGGHYETITDNTCGRIEASENYITTMDSNDKATLIAFDESPTVLCGISSDKQALTSSLQKISSDGGTDFDNAMQASIDSLNSCKDKNRKTIIFLSDGQDYISDSLLEKAKESNITIYSIGLGSDVDDSPLESMANYTGGKYYRATTADDLSNLFTKISMDDIDKTDTDGDGLYDVFETAGMKLANGRVIYTDPLKADTDGDGLKDGEEIIPVFRTMSDSGVPSDSLSKTSGVYFVMKSDPTMVDSDGDGYNDNVDKYPLGIWQPTSKLAKAVDAAGFLYDPQQNIIYSRMDPLQRKFGYCDAYDYAAGFLFNIDDEPIYFNYNQKKYRIELWKGQYGIETGGEVGVYYQDVPNTNLNLINLYKCVDDNSLLNIHFTFVRDDSILFTRGPEDHWWETGFRWGVDTPNTDDLMMEVRIDFSNCPGMTEPFTNELTQMGYRYTIDRNVVTFGFKEPHTYQPYSRMFMKGSVTSASSKLVDAYNLLKQELGITTDDPNVIEQQVLEKGDAEAQKTLNDIKLSMQGMLSVYNSAA